MSISRISKIVLTITSLVCISCVENPAPDSVLRSYISALAEGNCDLAMEVSLEEAKVCAYNKQQEGCETYKSEIISIECDTVSLIAECCVQEKVAGKTKKKSFELRCIDNSWKVSKVLKRQRKYCSN